MEFWTGWWATALAWVVGVPVLVALSAAVVGGLRLGRSGKLRRMLRLAVSAVHPLLSAVRRAARRRRPRMAGGPR